MLPFPTVLSGDPDMDWNSTCGMSIYMVKCILYILQSLSCSTRQYIFHTIYIPHVARIPTLLCGGSSGIHVWTFHGAQLFKRRWRHGIPLMHGVYYSMDLLHFFFLYIPCSK